MEENTWKPIIETYPNDVMGNIQKSIIETYPNDVMTNHKIDDG